jgi:hypothetical protein
VEWSGLEWKNEPDRMEKFVPELSKLYCVSIMHLDLFQQFEMPTKLG